MTSHGHAYEGAECGSGEEKNQRWTGLTGTNLTGLTTTPAQTTTDREEPTEEAFQ